MILLLSVLLANLLSVAITKDNKLDSANLTYEADNKDQTDVVMGKGFSLSVKDLLPLRSSDAAVRIYCTYGNNLSLEVAKKYTTYNYIVAKSALGDKEIIVEQPIYETKKNNCIVEEVKK
ncbi:hypothetical protein LJ128_003931 [Salmonella enterica]|nr:hypothetical protein [Salmonella enterica]EDN2304425.1 hypothetical protein [Salmonella enterica subsp. diarizonae serovar 65:(k):z]EDW4290648.1 hypothetical protein [Salmonella enterica subsp. diarizonae]EGO1763084.1 hypothetical protein [Salmonella enterica subsp. diarizonae serovar Rough:-:-]EAX7733902.1 hypothetical protein [Salmonella enterica]